MGPGGPILFQIDLEHPRLLCSFLDSSGGDWKGLDTTGCNALMYSFIELWVNVCRVPGPSTNRFLQCVQCCMIGSPLFEIVLLGGWSSDTQNLGES